MAVGDSLGDLDDYRWLVGSHASVLLRELSEHNESSLTANRRLRKTLSPERTRLVLEQLELRRRARQKFSRADQLFFDRVALEQATDEWIAEHKARRFSTQPVADLCCGIGGDMMALAAGRVAVGFDRDPIKCLLAAANLDALGLRAQSEIRVGDAIAIDLAAFAAWHIDPDRRAHGRRTVSLSDYVPDADALAQLLARQPQGAIKLAPATDVPRQWSEACELEWISRDGQCRQLVCWFGSLAHRCGERAATMVGRQGEWTHSVVGQPHLELPVEPLRAFLYEPDPAVLAAKLTGAVGTTYGLSAIAPASAYLTSDRFIDARAISAFAVLAILPFDRKKLRAELRKRRIGRLEIKKRAVQIDPERLRGELDLSGDNGGTLFVTTIGGRATAILAQRCPVGHPDSSHQTA